MSIFSQVPLPKIARSTHRLNHSYKLTGDFGKLYPVMTELAFAGDTWKIDLEQFVRSMPMIAPVMDMVDVKVDAFFCPIRLIWDDFEDWITLGPTGEASYDWPTIRFSGTTSTSATVNHVNAVFATGGSADYLNFPTPLVATVGGSFERELDACPFRVYQTIYNEYYRNQNLEVEIPIFHSSGRSTIFASSSGASYLGNFYLRQRGWNKDYFTSALPYPQKGPAVKMPFSDVKIEKNGDMTYFVKNWDENNNIAVGSYGQEIEVTQPIPPGDTDQVEAAMRTGNGDDDWTPLMYASGLKASYDPPTIEELRYTEVLQEFYEANARGGSRPKEYYKNIWHTNTKDSRLDRPEYLGGYRGPITISDIDQTSESNISAQGTPSGKGVSSGGSKVVRYRCSEHGYIMIILSITPRSSYYQGFRKMNLYRDVFDFPNPFFANLGEQEIKNLELYDDPTDNMNNETFGYTPRYAEAKFIPSTVHGQLRSTLNYWTLTRSFNTRPNLNAAFVHIQASELSRIFPNQVSDNDKFVATLYFHVKRRMYLPYWGIPRLIHSI